MKIFLMRHGEALQFDKHGDPPLSDRGKALLNKTANILKPQKLKVKHFLHSEKKRAIETAEIMLTSVTSIETPAVNQALSPNEPMQNLLQLISENPGDIFLVSHLPLVAKFANYLLCNNENFDSILFEPGTLVYFESKGYLSDWQLVWMINSNRLL